MSLKVAYIYDEALERESNRLPSVLNRASIVHDLIKSYNLLSCEQIQVTPSLKATEDELKYFHSSSFIDFLSKTNDCDDLEKFDEEQVEFGLGYDCPLLERCLELVKIIAGSSLTGAKLLNAKECDIAINWFGGWHHAQRNTAEGFCYVNDVVVAIQKMTEAFERILYIDLDIHHGDGVQNAFELSKRILTLSFHKHVPGFYPGTGNIDDDGISKGKYYSMNVPFMEGVSHKSFTCAFEQIFTCVFSSYKPHAIVVQCGADGLNGDPIGQSNLTLETFNICIDKILNCKLPTLFLGGGGYNLTNAAKLWTYITSLIVQVKLDNDIPDDSEYFPLYGPSYELEIEPGKQKDYNTEQYIASIVNKIYTKCENIYNES